MLWHPICFLCRLLDVNSLFTWLVRLFCNVCSLARWQSSTWKTPSCVCEEEHWCSLVSCASRHAQLGDSRLGCRKCKSQWVILWAKSEVEKQHFLFKRVQKEQRLWAQDCVGLYKDITQLRPIKKKRQPPNRKRMSIKFSDGKKKSLTLVLH